MAARVLDGGAPSPLQRLADDYIISCAARGLSPRSLDQYTYALDHVFLPWCEGQGITTRLGDLDRRTLDRFTGSLLQRPSARGGTLSRHSVHTYVRPVRPLLAWAEREGEEVKAQPQLPRREKPLRDVLSRGELDALEKAMPSERDQLIIRIFGDCGLRLEELTRLAPTDLVRSGRQAHLRILGKRSRIRDVPVPPTLLRRLDRLIDRRPEERSADRIFLSLRKGPSGEYEPLTPTGVYQVVKQAVARARLTKKVYAHLLRHSWMTEMLRCGMNPIQLSVIAGASMEVIAEHYAHLTKDDAHEAMLRAIGAGRRPS